MLIRIPEYEDYSGAYCALVFLRSAIGEFEKELGREEKNELLIMNLFGQIVYWGEQFYYRRGEARKFRRILKWILKEKAITKG